MERVDDLLDSLGRGSRAVGFDLDGTLFDPRGSATAAVQHLIRDLDREPSTELVSAWFDLEAEHFEAWRSGRASFEEQRRLRIGGVLRLLGVSDRDGRADPDVLLERYLAIYRRSWRAFDEARPVLLGLRARGIRIGVLTNGNHAQQTDKLRATGLAALVDAVCISEQIGYAKPDRRAFEVLADRLETPANTLLFVGDNPEHDVAGARAAGIRAGLVDHAGTSPISLADALRAASL
jgi:putative hydrolase of the HAD superfamily